MDKDTDLDPATEAKEKYKDPAEPINGSPNVRDLHDHIVDVRDESS